VASDGPMCHEAKRRSQVKLVSAVYPGETYHRLVTSLKVSLSDPLPTGEYIAPYSTLNRMPPQSTPSPGPFSMLGPECRQGSPESLVTALPRSAVRDSSPFRAGSDWL